MNNTLFVILEIKSICDDVEKKAVFVDVDKASDKCRFAIEFPILSAEDQSKWEDKFNGKFVQLRQSLFLLQSQQSALVSQVLLLTIYFFIKSKHIT